MSAPPTTARVAFETSKGSITIDLWAKEIPQISRRFISNCVNRKYVGKTFNKVIKDYIVQTQALEHESVDAKQFNSRIRFDQRGCVGAVKQGKHASVDSFFITMKETPEFDKDYVIFGRIVGDSFYTVLKMNEGELEGEKAVYPVEITGVSVIEQYFDDIKEEEKVEKVKEPPQKKRQVQIAFDDEEEEEVVDVKTKSAYELDKSLRKKEKRLKTEEKTGKAEDTDIKGNREEVGDEESRVGTQDSIQKLTKDSKPTGENEQTEETEQTEANSIEKVEDESLAHGGKAMDDANDEKVEANEKDSVTDSPPQKHVKEIFANRDVLLDPTFHPYLDLSDSDDIELTDLKAYKLS